MINITDKGAAVLEDELANIASPPMSGPPHKAEDEISGMLQQQLKKAEMKKAAPPKEKKSYIVQPAKKRPVSQSKSKSPVNDKAAKLDENGEIK